MCLFYVWSFAFTKGVDHTRASSLVLIGVLGSCCRFMSVLSYPVLFSVFPPHPWRGLENIALVVSLPVDFFCNVRTTIFGVGIFTMKGGDKVSTCSMRAGGHSTCSVMQLVYFCRFLGGRTSSRAPVCLSDVDLSIFRSLPSFRLWPLTTGTLEFACFHVNTSFHRRKG